MNKIIYVLLLIIVLFQSACIKSSVIGGDILKDDEINVDFSDTSTLKARTIINDSFKVYPNLLESYLLGQFQDDNFGKAKAGIYCDFQYLGSIPETNITDVDSVVLTIVLDTSMIYGDKNVKHIISVYELDESIYLDRDSIYSNEKIKYNSQKLGQKEIFPIIDSVTVIEPKKDTVVYKEQVRITLDKSLGLRLLSDTTNLKSDTLLKTMFKGVYIESNTNNSSMISLKRLSSGNRYATRIDVYYTLNDTLNRSTFTYDNIVNHFNHNYSSAKIIDYFDNFEKGNDLLFVQGMDGTKVEVDIPYLEFLKDKNINKAELILYVVGENETEVNPPKRLVTKYLNDNGNLELIEDYIFPENIRNTDPNIYFGYKIKSKENGKELSKFIVNITMHIKRMLKDEKYSTKLFLYPENRIHDPGFAKLAGTNNSSLKSKLKITYSNIN